MINEKNIIIKDWRTIDISFGLIYPSNYHIGMSSYSIKYIYSYLNSFQNIVCERLFLPESIKFPAKNDYNPVNKIISIETGILPTNFDILGFSIQFENDFRNILWFLDKAKIPYKAHKRREIENKSKKIFPLIIGGGPVATANPLPLSQIFDLFFIGDAEKSLLEFLKSFLQFKFENNSLEKLFNDLKNVRGIYIPSIKNTAVRAVIQNLDDYPVPTIQLISKSTEKEGVFEEGFFLEVSRGCPFQCKFCISSYHNYPFRYRSYDNLIKTIDNGIENSSFKSINLIGSCISSHPRFLDLCNYIVNKKLQLSIPSIRIDHISTNLIEILEKGNIRTITIAPESGSQTLRYNLGKRISDDIIFKTVSKIKDSKIENIKMYFLLGLKEEKDEDIKNLINMVNKFDRMDFNKDSVRISINPVVPKLNTPYENHVDFYIGDKLKILQNRFKIVSKALKGLKSVNLRIGNPKDLVKKARLQTIFSLGDTNIGNLLIKYYEYGATYGSLRRAEKELNISIDDYLLKVKQNYTPWAI
ncbi:MAG: radical SAM protein [Candidatus Lokiarchaeota archaeon]|nr:radical SAM protein [Candidatus Lokiarchaeota archaeon]MBD3198554.1 radical SAM protein [Candidatus Lokiarchaeota archaeon]